MKSQVEKYFDRALMLEPGEEILIPCPSKKEQNSMRVQLYRQRKAFKEQTGQPVEDQVGISTRVVSTITGPRRLVVLYQKAEQHRAILVKQDGSVIDLEEEGYDTQDLERGKTA